MEHKTGIITKKEKYCIFRWIIIIMRANELLCFWEKKLQNFIEHWPHSDDEFKQLEENILKEGKLISPLIVWNNTLVDGHNRYAILQKHPEIYFSTMPLPFESREEVLAWICKNQLGRRNLTPEQKYYLMGKQYEAEKAAHGGNRIGLQDCWDLILK